MVYATAVHRLSSGIRLAAAAFLFVATIEYQCATAAASPPLELQTRVTLGVVRGRIDHLALDPGRKRLFIAEFGNDSVGVVDLATLRIVRRLAGLHEPQGVAYSAAADALYVSNAANGSVRVFRGPDLAPAGTLALGDDADNVRVDDVTRRVLIGYGGGAIAVIDSSSGRRLADIRLRGHPESFQLAADGSRMFVNVPDAGEIAVVDRQWARQVAAWPTGKLAGNFPLALDESNRRVIAIFRRPPVLAIFDEANGRAASIVATCADADDVFLDSARRRAYVICGEGYIDVFEESQESYRRLARVPTVAGARTGLWVDSRAQLFVAVRAGGAAPAAIWIFRAEEPGLKQPQGSP